MSPLLRLAALGLLTASLPAAPPAVTGLFPAGLQRGTTARLELLGKPGTRPVSVWCDELEVTAVVDPQKDVVEVTATAAARPGLAWLRFYNAEGAAGLIPLVIGLVSEVTETEPNNTLAEATRVQSLPAVANGVLHKSGEVDLYTVVVRAGETLVASLDARQTLGSPLDGVLQIISERGFVLAHNDDHHGADPLVAWRAEADATVAVRVFAFPAEPNSTVNFAGGADYVYRLTLTTGPFITQAVSAGGDGDATSWRAVSGWNLPEEGVDPATAPGLHWHVPGGVWRGAVVASVAGKTPEEQPRLELGQPVVGRLLHPAAQEQYCFSARKDQTFRLQVAARSHWSLLDPVLSVLDKEGKALKESDDLSRENLDVDMEWKAPAEGEYRAVVADRYGHGGDGYGFQLLVGPDRPRVELSVAEDHWLLKPGASLDVAVTVDRKSAYDGELTVTAEGLPEGVQASAAVSKGKGDSSKRVTLKLTAGKEAGYHGPIRLVGRAEGDAESVIPVTTGTRVPGQRTSEFWLSVPTTGNNP